MATIDSFAFSLTLKQFLGVSISGPGDAIYSLALEITHQQFLLSHLILHPLNICFRTNLTTFLLWFLALLPELRKLNKLLPAVRFY